MAAAAGIIVPLVLQELPAIAMLVETLIGSGHGQDKKGLALKVVSALHNGLVDLHLASGPPPDTPTTDAAIDTTVATLNKVGVLQGKDTGQIGKIGPLDRMEIISQTMDLIVGKQGA